MMPMVFWASFRPWLVAMKAEETIWSFLKAVFTVRGWAFTNTHVSSTMSR